MEILTKENIMLDVISEDKMSAISRLGRKLVENGYVDEPYIEGMIKRENSLTTYMANGVAIPHAMPEYTQYIKHSGIVIAQYRNGVDFGSGNTAKLLVGIAGIGADHMQVLSQVAIVCTEESNVEEMAFSNDPQAIIELIEREGN